MKLLPAVITGAISVALIFVLNTKWGPLPPLGKLLSPQQGFWQNATPIGELPEGELSLPGLKGKAEVWFDDRMVPHVFAENEADLYYVQGYLHARDRLWQMELQVFAAAGRLSELLGPSLVQYDRTQRRMGMVYGSEQTLKGMEANPATKNMVDRYSEGINAYIASLSSATLPVEYKLLDYRPEAWTPLKCALLLKYMSYDLTGYSLDREYTNARHQLSYNDFNVLYPDFLDSLSPIIPKGTAYEAATASAVAPPDSLLLANQHFMKFREDKPDPDNGSNNWAVAGSKTRSGAPILCNDPHLGLSLPSLWYEIQLHTPDMNVYGASLPGAPGVIIGFNDHIAWGVTNAEEDVKDYYLVEFPNGKKQYRFNGQLRDASLREEVIKVRGGKAVKDTVAYTVWGPVIYDNSFPDRASKQQYLALRWTALDSSNELSTFYELNKARNYDEYEKAIRHFDCPGQNFVFAAKNGDIAIWHNGKFPLRWKDQGKWIMPGSDSTYAWQGYVPREALPHIKNPERGFVSSANQRSTDNTYPYNMYGYFDLFRAKRINERLATMNQISPQDMMALQMDNKNLFAQTAIPMLRKHLDTTHLSKEALRYWLMVANWDCMANPNSNAATIFYEWWADFEQRIWKDDMHPADSTVIAIPDSEVTLLALVRDSSLRFVDDRNTPEKESLAQQVQESFVVAAKKAAALEKAGQLPLGLARGTDILHLSRGIPAFSAMHLNTGGGQFIVNATKKMHGPSWRMVVQLSDKTEAYGIYPGGQSGNPGSPFYDNSVADWVAGKYYQLHIFDPKQKDDPTIKARMVLTKEN